MSPAAWLLAVVLGVVGGLGVGYWRGDLDASAREVAKQDAQTVKDLTGLIQSQKDLIADAGKASAAMRGAVALRQKSDAQSTKELRDALSKTASERAGCLFPADVMRQLAEAHGRAAQAAAGGVRGALPSAGTGTGGP